LVHRRRFQLNPYPEGWLFYHTTTARHHRAGDRVKSFYDAFKTRVERAGLPLTLRQHDLRHSRITWLLATGAPPQQVQALAGHSTLKMTERYYAYAHEHQEALEEYFPQVVNL
jgi:integrase